MNDVTIEGGAMRKLSSRGTTWRLSGSFSRILGVPSAVIPWAAQLWGRTTPMPYVYGAGYQLMRYSSGTTGFQGVLQTNGPLLSALKKQYLDFLPDRLFRNPSLWLIRILSLMGGDGHRALRFVADAAAPATPTVTMRQLR